MAGVNIINCLLQLLKCCKFFAAIFLEHQKQAPRTKSRSDSQQCDQSHLIVRDTKG